MSNTAPRALVLPVCLLAAIVTAACGGSSSSPTSPTTTAAAATITAVTVTSAASGVWLGQQMQMSAATTLSNGSNNSTPSGTWGTDAPGVATVNSSGVVTTLGPGDVTVYFDATGGGRGTKRLTVYADFQGTWTGSYQIQSCTHTGYFQATNFCGSFAVGQVLPFSITATISNSGVVTANWLLGSLNFGPTSGTAGAFFSSVTLSATHFDTSLPSASVWQLTQTSPNRISGTLQVTFTSSSYVGSGIFSGPITSFTKSLISSSIGAGAMATVRTFEELKRALGVR